MFIQLIILKKMESNRKCITYSLPPNWITQIILETKLRYYLTQYFIGVCIKMSLVWKFKVLLVLVALIVMLASCDAKRKNKLKKSSKGMILRQKKTNPVNFIRWADRTKAVGRDGVEKKFHHPFFQVICVSVGCMPCLVVYKVLFWVLRKRGDGSEDEHKLTKGNRDFNPLILAIPAFLGLIAGSLMYVGLNLTYASSYQMLRGAVIVFVALLSMVFLKRKIGLKQWTGIFFVILGLGTVGLADYVSKGSEESLNTYEIIIGDLLIVFAQIIAAVQFVIEEKFVAGQDMPPLQAVGWDSVFGFVMIIILHIPMYFIKADRPLTQHKGDRMEDIIDAFVQIGNSWQLQVAVTISIISVGFFNFAGVTLTKEVSATTRKVLDNIRTIIIWCFSLAFFGQQFHWLQLLGFCMLVFGIFLYNNLIDASTFSICTRTGQGEESNSNAEAAGPK